ncbi:MAG: dihydrodipicolinate reductase [Candidatus Diapherotrites archaeon]|nr:dihydrodipicolinate reductase [Candidatus Diapherotrites archaeon]
MAKKIRVIQYGLGTIGMETARLCLEKQSLELAGAIDIDPQKAGKDAGELCNGKRAGVTVSDSAKKVFSGAKADVVVHTTVSSLAKAEPQIIEALESGLNVVSTTEELSFPIGENRKIAERLDKIAGKNNVSVLGVGVNPGFVMDALPLMLTAPCQKIEKIEITRQIDASNRRVPFQKKIGSTLSVEEFDKKVAEGTIRHVGLPESLSMIAHCLGFKDFEFSQTISPIISDKEIALSWGTISMGSVRGVKQTASAKVNGKEIISMNFRAGIGEAESFDAVKIHGVPPIDMKISGGTHGDRATAAIAVNMVPVAFSAGAGLKTMADFVPKILA